MKILHITATHLNPTGGVVAVLKNLSEEQNRICGIESKVLSMVAKVDDVQSDFFYFLGGQSVYSFIENYRPDMAILHSFYYMEYVITANALKKLHIPFFIEPHGSFGKQAMKKSHLKKVIANKTVFRSQIRDSQGYIFTNQAEYLDSVYRTKNELVIPNGIVPDVVYSAQSKSPSSIKDPVIYFLGRYDIHHKGLDYLFDALDILERQGNKITVKLYGTGDEKQMEYVSTRVSNYRNLNVKDGGPIYGNKKKTALEHANILILTSRYEGSPMTVLDGLSYGNPCIATPGTNIADEVAGNNIGWRAELSANSIAQTILKALSEYKSDGDHYYNRCKKYVLENYSWDKIAEYSIEQYKKALGT